MKTFCILNYYSDNFILVPVIVSGVILYFIIIVIRAEIEKYRIRKHEEEEENKRQKELRYELALQRERKKIDEERAKEELKWKQRNAEIEQEKQKQEKIKKEKQYLADIEIQNKVLSFPDSFLFQESYEIDYKSSNEISIKLKCRKNQIPLSIERFYNLYINQGENIEGIKFVDEYMLSGLNMTLRNVLDKNPEFKVHDIHMLIVIKKLCIRNTFVNKSDVALYKRIKYSKYLDYLIEMRKLNYPNETYSTLLREKYGHSTPIKEIIDLERRNCLRMLYSSDLIEGTTEDDLHFIPVFHLR